MGEVDYMQIDSLQRQVNAHSASISSAQSRITTIDEKIGAPSYGQEVCRGNPTKMFTISSIPSCTEIFSQNGKANKRMISPSSGKSSPVTTRVFKRR